jgi:hypothetical protein
MFLDVTLTKFQKINSKRGTNELILTDVNRQIWRIGFKFNSFSIWIFHFDDFKLYKNTPCGILSPHLEFQFKCTILVLRLSFVSVFKVRTMRRWGRIPLYFFILIHNQGTCLYYLFLCKKGILCKIILYPRWNRVHKLELTEYDWISVIKFCLK